jgi:hypothetical protein
MKRNIREFITVSTEPDGRVRATVQLAGDPNGLQFSIVRDTYDECIAEWHKFDGWMEN